MRSMYELSLVHKMVTRWSPYHSRLGSLLSPLLRRYCEPLGSPSVSEQKEELRKKKGRQGNRSLEPVPGYKYLTNFFMGYIFFFAVLSFF